MKLRVVDAAEAVKVKVCVVQPRLLEVLPVVSNA